jgi:hypothetical protein
MFCLLRARGVCLFLFLAAVPLFGAGGTASWIGLLRDSSGNPGPEAVIELRSTSGATYSAKTSANGTFAFPEITAGKYQLSVTVSGRAFKCVSDVTISAGAMLTAELRLSSPGQAAVEMNTDTASYPQASGGERLSSSEVSSLPLNSRDFSKLLLLAAGTMTDANGAANFTQQFAVNGQRGSATVFALDGADTTDPEMGGATFSNFNIDAIQEVQANSGVMPAEIGHGAASYTNVVTRSGTNAIHGSAFEFIRNASLDARNYFDHVGFDRRRIPPFIRNEFGGTIGGPVVLPGMYDGRDRTFFFGEYQGFRQILGTTQVFPMLTADERKGIDAISVPGDTLMVPVLDRMPLPNDPNGSFGMHTYATSSKVTTVTDQFSVRVDHKISDKAQLLTRFSLNQVTGPLTNPDQTAIDPSFAIRFFDHQRNAVVRYTRTISPHLTSETSLGYIRSTPTTRSQRFFSAMACFRASGRQRALSLDLIRTFTSSSKT